ncbi:MAG: type IV secretion system DNA-binding domain-containing protein [Sterolibacterium sp.]
MRYKDKLPENWEMGFTVGAIAAVLTFLVSSWLLWQLPYPYAMSEYIVHLKHWAALRLYVVLPFLTDTAREYQSYFDRIQSHTSPLWFTARFDLALGLATFCGAWLGYLTGKPDSAIRHVVGRQLWRGKDAQNLLSQLSRKECEVSWAGLLMHPDFQWRLSYDRETRHFLILGSIGGGKTAIIIPLVKAAIARGDKVVIYDNKGDFTSWLPHGVLLAPWDQRSAKWDIGMDCRNAQDARELADRLIPEGLDPLWHTAARQILKAIIIKCQSEYGTSWGWHTLYQIVCLPREELMCIVQRHLPEARHVVDAPGKTAQSILVNFGAHMTLISDLAKAWGNPTLDNGFSFVDWLKDPNPKRRVLVLQGSGKYSALAKSYIQSILALMSAHINSIEFEESRERRLWFILDEFPQLGKLEQVAPLLEIGRSKGIRVVLGAQDSEQIKELYGDHIARSWMSMVGTQIIVRINAGETANYLAKEVIGYRSIDRTVMHEGKPQAPVREDILVMEPSELHSDLGPDKRGVNALLLGYGDAFILHWPFTTVEKLRSPAVPATWLTQSASNHVQPTIEASVDTKAPTDANPPKRQRLILRQQDEELIALAACGTSIIAGAEPAMAMTDTPVGGNHESC